MEMVLNLPLGRRTIRGPYSNLWDSVFDPTNIENGQVWKLSRADCEGKSFKHVACSAQSAGRTRHLRVITRTTVDSLYLKVEKE